MKDFMFMACCPEVVMNISVCIECVFLLERILSILIFNVEPLQLLSLLAPSLPRYLYLLSSPAVIASNVLTSQCLVPHVRALFRKLWIKETSLMIFNKRDQSYDFQ